MCSRGSRQSRGMAEIARELSLRGGRSRGREIERNTIEGSKIWVKRREKERIIETKRGRKEGGIKT